MTMSLESVVGLDGLAEIGPVFHECQPTEAVPLELLRFPSSLSADVESDQDPVAPLRVPVPKQPRAPAEVAQVSVPPKPPDPRQPNGVRVDPRSPNLRCDVVSHNGNPKAAPDGRVPSAYTQGDKYLDGNGHAVHTMVPSLSCTDNFDKLLHQIREAHLEEMKALRQSLNIPCAISTARHEWDALAGIKAPGLTPVIETAGINGPASSGGQKDQDITSGSAGDPDKLRNLSVAQWPPPAQWIPTEDAGESFANLSHADRCKKIVKLQASKTMARFNEIMEQEEQIEGQTWTARAGRFVKHPLFEVSVVSVLLFNIATLSVEYQCASFDIGPDLGFYSNGANQCADAVVYLMDVCEVIFGMVFVLECALKMFALRLDFLRDIWNISEVVIILCWVIGMCQLSGFPVGPNVLRFIRMARFVRFVRLLRTFHSLDEIFTITTAMKQSVSVLCWASLLLFGIHLMFALLANQIFSSYFTDETIPLEDRQAVYMYFGTLTRSLFTMFELTLANWPPVARILIERVSEWFMVVGVLYKLTMGFTVVGVINGVIMQETFKAAAADDRLMMRQKRRAMKTHAGKMKMLFRQADPECSGRVDLPTFREVLANPQVKVWLASQDLDASDADKLFVLLDDGDGTLSADELVHGVARLRGHARSIDLWSLSYEHERLQTLFGECLDELSKWAASFGLHLPAGGGMCGALASINKGRFKSSVGGETTQDVSRSSSPSTGARQSIFEFTQTLREPSSFSKKRERNSAVRHDWDPTMANKS